MHDSLHPCSFWPAGVFLRIAPPVMLVPLVRMFGLPYFEQCRNVRQGWM